MLVSRLPRPRSSRTPRKAVYSDQRLSTFLIMTALLRRYDEFTYRRIAAPLPMVLPASRADDQAMPAAATGRGHRSRATRHRRAVITGLSSFSSACRMYDGVIRAPHIDSPAPGRACGTILIYLFCHCVIEPPFRALCPTDCSGGWIAHIRLMPISDEVAESRHQPATA
jgi:hypothetical protein